MSQEDLELIRGVYEAWLAGDRDAAAAGVHPDIEWVEPPDSPDADIHRGYEGIVYSTERWTEPFEDYSFEVQNFRDLGDGKVLVEMLQHGRARGSAVPVEGTVFFLWTVRDGRAVRAAMFRSEQDALEALLDPPALP